MNHLFIINILAFSISFLASFTFSLNPAIFTIGITHVIFPKLISELDATNNKAIEVISNKSFIIPNPFD